MSVSKRFICIFVFLELFIIIFNVVSVQTQLSEPNYSLHIHMEKRESWEPEQITVRYVISGLGGFEYGHIAFFSDVKNIHQNSYTFTQAKYTEDGLQILDTIDNSNMVDELIANWNILTAYIEASNYETNTMVGAFKIDTKDLDKGSYSISVIFTAKHNGRNYVFQDSINYQILSIWDVLITPINFLIAVTSLFTSLLGIYTFRLQTILQKILKNKESKDFDSNII